MICKIGSCVSHLVDEQEPFVLIWNEEYVRFQKHSFESISDSSPQGGFSICILDHGPVTDSIKRGNGQSCA